jgi:hypothetical protein
MKKLMTLAALAMLFACNNSKKEEKTVTGKENSTQPADDENIRRVPEGDKNTLLTIDGKEVSLSGSLLVTRDDKKLHPGAAHFCILTAMNGPDDESLSLNFVIDTKPGVYPVVGMSLSRGVGDNGQVFGGLLGGEPKLTEYKVTLTDVKDLGSNGMGGHKWSISGHFENITIPAMKIMLMDKTKNHPAEVKLDKGSFTNLSFDDNWEEMMKKATEQMK